MSTAETVSNSSSPSSVMLIRVRMTPDRTPLAAMMKRPPRVIICVGKASSISTPFVMIGLRKLARSKIRKTARRASASFVKTTTCASVAAIWSTRAPWPPCRPIESAGPSCASSSTRPSQSSSVWLHTSGTGQHRPSAPASSIWPSQSSSMALQVSG